MSAARIMGDQVCLGPATLFRRLPRVNDGNKIRAKVFFNPDDYTG
jgi:hypothetical protein